MKTDKLAFRDSLMNRTELSLSRKEISLFDAIRFVGNEQNEEITSSKEQTFFETLEILKTILLLL